MSVVSRGDVLRAGGTSVVGGDAAPPAPTFVSASELRRIKQSTTIRTAEDIKREKAEAAARMEKRQAVSKARKVRGQCLRLPGDGAVLTACSPLSPQARMLKLEAERKKNAPPSVLEMEKRKENEEIRRKGALLVRFLGGAAAAVAAAPAADAEADAPRLHLTLLCLRGLAAKFLTSEELDDVKTMNAFAAYAKTVTIRNEQKVEKEVLAKKLKEAEKVKDIAMELDRLKVVKMYQDREAERKAKMVADRKVIEHQISLRAKKREEAKAAIRAEQAAKKRELEREAEEEKVELAKAQERQREHLKQVLEANAAAIAAKEKLKLDEIEEDKRIMAYLKEEDEKKRQREEEEARVKQQREMEIARLRAQQEKFADKAAELDALRAKRAFEASEREYRKRMLREAEKRVRAQAELNESRAKQKADREWELALEAKRQREEFHRNLALQEEWMEREKAERDAKLRAAHAHKDEILVEISEREKLRKKERQVFLAQAKTEQAQREADLERLRRIRNRKVQELLDQGVDERYTVQLQGYKPENVLLKDYKLGGRVPTIN